MMEWRHCYCNQHLRFLQKQVKMSCVKQVDIMEYNELKAAHYGECVWIENCT